MSSPMRKSMNRSPTKGRPSTAVHQVASDTGNLRKQLEDSLMREQDKDIEIERL